MLADVLDKDFHYQTPEFEGGLDTLLEDMASGYRRKCPEDTLTWKMSPAHHDVALLTWLLVSQTEPFSQGARSDPGLSRRQDCGSDYVCTFGFEAVTLAQIVSVDPWLGDSRVTADGSKMP